MPTVKQNKSKTQTSVETAITIIEAATNEGLSLSEASRQSNFGRNYVSDVKAKIEVNFETKKINRETYRTFKRVLKTYNKVSS